MARAGQSSIEYIIVLAFVLIAAGSAVYLLRDLSDTQITASRADSMVYWSSQASPLRVVEATQAQPAPCAAMSANSTGYGLVLLNSDSTDTVTLTGVKMDGANRTFCLKGRAATSSVPIDPGKKVAIGVNYTKGCQAGSMHDLSLNLTYNKGQFSNRTEIGAKKLVISCVATISA